MDNFNQTPPHLSSDSPASSSLMPGYSSGTAAAPLPFMVTVPGAALPFSVVYKEEPQVGVPAVPAVPEATVKEEPEREAERRREVPVPSALNADSAYGSSHDNSHENSPDKLEIVVQNPPLNVTYTLSEEPLWKAFHKVGNEMIVTKPGRRLFPALLVTLRGLEPTKAYKISIKIASADQYRYKFLSMQWTKAGDSEVNQNEARQIYHHPDSPSSGTFWMKKPISFRDLKITHNMNSKTANILLHTMHKYLGRLVITPEDGSDEIILDLPETTFMAVSAYQNTALTQMKIDNNPYAKGFRERRSVPFQPPYTQPSPAYPDVRYYNYGYKPAVIGSPIQTISRLQPLQTIPQGQFQPALARANGQPLQALHHFPSFSMAPYPGCVQSVPSATFPSTSAESVPPLPPPITSSSYTSGLTPYYHSSTSLPSQLAPYYQTPTFTTAQDGMGITPPTTEEY